MKKPLEETQTDQDTLVALLKYSQSAARIGGWQLDIETGNLLWTDETYRIHDTSPEEFNPTVDAGVSYFLPESREQISAALQKATTEGIGYALELETHTTKGRYIEVFTTCEVTIKDGKPIKLTGIFQDITESKRAQRVIAREESRLRSIVETAIDAIILINETGEIFQFNRAAEAMFGYRAEEVISKNVSCLMPERTSIAHNGFIDHYIETGENKIIGIGREVIARRSNGDEFPIDLSITEWFDDGNRMFTGLVRDITDRLETQAKLIQSQKMESISLLSTGLAHDFNNILGVMVGNLELLRVKLTEHQLKQRIDKVLVAAERAASITARLLRFSKQAPESELTSHEINQLIEEVVDILSDSLGKQYRLKVNLGNEPTFVNLDPAEFENVILNLGLNARDAMPSGGVISIKVNDPASNALAADDNWINIQVSDEGHGIPEQIINDIFTPFFTTKEAKGTGLGLAMAYSFAQRCKGRIEARNNDHRGACFSLYLPVTNHQDPVAPKELRLQAQAGETVLVVDDEIDLQTAIADQLLSLGYNVLRADNAKQALQIISSTPKLDLLYSDIMMPGGMSGVELANAAKNALPNLNVLLSSGLPIGDAQRSQFKVLKKPVTRFTLSREIRKLLDASITVSPD